MDLTYSDADDDSSHTTEVCFPHSAHARNLTFHSEATVTVSYLSEEVIDAGNSGFEIDCFLWCSSAGAEELVGEKSNATSNVTEEALTALVRFIALG